MTTVISINTTEQNPKPVNAMTWLSSLDKLESSSIYCGGTHRSDEFQMC